MITHEHFLNLIVREPENAEHRQVYADWLEEQGDLRANFLRRQLAGNANAVSLVVPYQRDHPAWWAVMASLAQSWRELRFSDGELLPVREAYGQRGRIVTFESQFHSPDLKTLLPDLRLLTMLQLQDCYYGAACEPTYPFLCEPPDGMPPYTARQILNALHVREFSSEHIPSLDESVLPYPGYHPSTDNDEIHTDPVRQFIFPQPRDQEFAGRASAYSG